MMTMIRQALVAVLIVLFAVGTSAATTLHWTPPTSGSVDGYMVKMDDNVLMEFTQETSLNIDNLSLDEGQTYTFEVYTVDVLSDTVTLMSPPHRLIYTHRGTEIVTTQDVATPSDAHVVVDVNININQ
jgi:hypothetical protein